MEENQTTSLAYATLNTTGNEMLIYFMENDEYLEEEKGRILLPIMFGIIVLLGVTGNGLVIYSYISRKQMRTLTNMLILNLATADLLFLVICIPLTAFRFIASFWPLGDIGCKISQYCVYVSVYVGIYTLVLMAISRYCAIVHPLSSIRIRTKRNVVAAIILTWTICLLGFFQTLAQFKVYYFRSINGERSVCENAQHIRNIDKEQIFFTIFCVFGYALPLTIIIVLYGLIVKHVLNSKDPSIAEDAQEMNQERQLRNKRVARLIFFVVATFAFCWLPFHIIVLGRKYGAWNMQTTDEINTFVSLLLVAKCIAYANSCMNPFLYLFMSRAFRETFKEALCCARLTYQPSTYKLSVFRAHFERH